MNDWRACFSPHDIEGCNESWCQDDNAEMHKWEETQLAQLFDLSNTWSKCKPPNFLRNLCSNNPLDDHWHETLTPAIQLTSSLMWWPLNWRRLYLADAAEHKRLPLVIPVGSHSQVHLLWAGVFLEGLTHSQDGIGRTHLHSAPPWAAIIVERSVKNSMWKNDAAELKLHDQEHNKTFWHMKTKFTLP